MKTSSKQLNDKATQIKKDKAWDETYKKFNATQLGSRQRELKQLMSKWKNIVNKWKGIKAKEKQVIRATGSGSCEVVASELENRVADFVAKNYNPLDNPLDSDGPTHHGKDVVTIEDDKDFMPAKRKKLKKSHSLDSTEINNNDNKLWMMKIIEKAEKDYQLIQMKIENEKELHRLRVEIEQNKLRILNAIESQSFPMAEAFKTLANL